MNIHNLDKSHMLRDLTEFPNQISKTLKDLKNWKNPYGKWLPQNIVFCGMGGSAICGDIVHYFVENQIKTPFSIVRNYYLPDFINKDSLVIVCSYSGNTEETISCFKEALKKPAKILVISSNGRLESFAKKHHIPFFQLKYKSQCGQPRVNSGAIITAILGLLQKINLIKVPQSEYIDSINKLKQHLQKWLPKKPSDLSARKNLPLQIAIKVKNKIPVIYGTGFTTPIAFRWKQDLNETGKHVAFWEVSPECNHNTVVGYEYPKSSIRNMFFLALISSFDHIRNKKRWTILKTIWQKTKIDFIEIEARGKTKLEQLFYLVLLSMYTSFYLALLQKIDPTPVKIIDFLKIQLAQTK